jgi:hypothetical protein
VAKYVVQPTGRESLFAEDELIATKTEIARNFQEAASGTREVSGDIAICAAGGTAEIGRNRLSGTRLRRSGAVHRAATAQGITMEGTGSAASARAGDAPGQG